ncbi:SusD/RagB family nutrient-binding outer membrane lipoprotein [Flavobacteriaceae bacterium TP-CH-4]|uniref:SusD/RagB family nutrient-binding outer membrane lipoprotein n=1 Tax=Pelagihabitans pacificus TaxID=2696054 RepID=A0A967AQ32_9FLAO|nr:SusD/RagB family nutrient-binding outer membrane lipoprotein [Pelagihabitans pacificus]NHF57922.1 SusD/RagB family nutrient-binding outer membrane lipoprotein [Pelagihabitans pacificus]
MKKIFKITSLTSVLGALLLLSACETTELRVVDSPNDLSPQQASVDFFLNQIQIMTAQIHSGEEGRAENGLSQFGMEPVRMQHGFGPTYRDMYDPTDFDRLWDNVYARALIDIRTMNPLAEEAEQFTHLAIGQILEAYIMMSMVDFFGDVPYSEALRGSEGILNPTVDSGASIYEAVDQLLLDAIANLNKDELVLPTNDLFYGGDEGQWIKLANTMRLKLYLQTRLVNSAESTSVINSLISGGQLILDSSDDFFFQWGTSNAAPDSRHPWFDANYDGAGPSSDFYTCNYFMDLMANQYGEPDPRIRYYFYRQVSDFSGADVVTKECVTEISTPSWWAPDEPYCLVPNINGLNGYWGRNHLDDDGIPPDDAFRTLHGVYPIGGPFDDDSFRNVSGSAAITEGYAGAGISPIMMSSYTNFMLAEAALTLGTTGDARAYLESGIRESIGTVTNFGAALAAGSTFTPSSAVIDSHIAEILSNYDSGDDTDKLRIIVEQYFIALWGNGIEAYNTYRRTGQPDNLTPGFVLADSGTFLRSMWYSQTATDSNSSFSQKAAPDTPVFWDTNPEGFVD